MESEFGISEFIDLQKETHINLHWDIWDGFMIVYLRILAINLHIQMISH